MTDPDDRTEELATRAALRELVDSVQRLEPWQRELLGAAFVDGRTVAVMTDQPGLARVYDSLQALVLQLRRAWKDI